MATADVDDVRGIDVVRSDDASLGAGDVIVDEYEDLSPPGDNTGIDGVIRFEASRKSRDVPGLVVDVIRMDVDFADEVEAGRFGSVMVTSSLDVTGP